MSKVIASASRGTSHRYIRIIAMVLLALSAVSSAYAQLASTTSLVGNVADSANAIISGATITATNEATRETYTGTTSTAGYYEMKFRETRNLYGGGATGRFSNDGKNRSSRSSQSDCAY